MPTKRQVKLAETIMAAARRSLSEYGVNTEKAADDAAVARGSVGSARVILELGTPEQIEAAIKGEISLDRTARALKALLTPEQVRERKHRAYVSTWSPERRTSLQEQAELWAQFAPALKVLGGLPNPASMVDVVKANNGRFMIVNQLIDPVTNWMKEFNDEWAKYRRSRENSADAGNGGEVVGTQHPEPTTE